MTRREELIQFMSEKKLSIAEVAELLGRTQSTVRFWRSNGGRGIPADTFELLKVKAEGRESQ